MRREAPHPDHGKGTGRLPKPARKLQEPEEEEEEAINATEKLVYSTLEGAKSDLV